MFKEFAIDPSAIVRSDRDLVYVLEKFGMHQGRFISQFPAQWKRMAYEAAKGRHGGKVELTKIEIRLGRMRDGVLRASGRPGGDPASPWFQRAATEHGQRPFDAIVTEDGHGQGPFVPLDEFDENHACLAPNRQWLVRRDAQSLAATCALHLRTAKHVKLVDPHFDLSRRRYRRPFEAMLIAAGLNRPMFDIYRNDGPGEQDAIRRTDLSAREAARQGFEIRLFLRPERAMHNRFVLTERGGIMFGTGLDDDDDGNGNPNDDVSLLDPPVWEQRWVEFADDAPVAHWERGAI